ncbi:MAG: VOC family protein [Verrucomicrobiota bacterium]
MTVLESILYVDDIDRAEAFYTRLFRLEVEHKEPGRHLFLKLEHSMLLLFQPDRTSQDSGDGDSIDVPTHGAYGPGHLAFRMHHEEAVTWRAKLASEAIPLEREIRWPNGGLSLYFRDPAQNSLELATPDLWNLS